jgi:hypothetical protein
MVEPISFEGLRRDLRVLAGHHGEPSARAYGPFGSIVCRTTPRYWSDRSQKIERRYAFLGGRSTDAFAPGVAEASSGWCACPSRTRPSSSRCAGADPRQGCAADSAAGWEQPWPELPERHLGGGLSCARGDQRHGDQQGNTRFMAALAFVPQSTQLAASLWRTRGTLRARRARASLSSACHFFHDAVEVEASASGAGEFSQLCQLWADELEMIAQTGVRFDCCRACLPASCSASTPTAV